MKSLTEIIAEKFVKRVAQLPYDEALVWAKKAYKRLKPLSEKIGFVCFPQDTLAVLNFVVVLTDKKPDFSDFPISVGIFKTTLESYEATFMYYYLLGEDLIYIKKKALENGFKFTRYGLFKDTELIANTIKDIYSKLEEETPECLLNAIKIKTGVEPVTNTCPII